MKLSLFNTLTKKRENFTPIDANLVTMYVCGPTVYDRPHIGNARSVVVYDILYRVLIGLYGKSHVKYVRNITDIDDKIISRALSNNISISQLTEETTEYFHHDMRYLGCLIPDIEPKATDHIKEMINMIERLMAQGVAYKVNNHIYFDVRKAENYTQLSGRSLEEMISGTRVEMDLDKKHPADFVLWKPASDQDDPSAKFDSPFGLGRPGWHIECSAMSTKYLGDTFDIHGGGIDLIFPHHTNEIAQSICASPNSDYAKFWVHNGFLTVNHEKMSKSLGNFIIVKDLIDAGIKGDAARFFLLSNHYRKPLDYNDKAIKDAGKMISYWYRAIENLSEIVLIENFNKLPIEFIDALLDDLNIHIAIRLINDYAREIHSCNDLNLKHILATKMYSCANFLGLMQKSVINWFQSVDDLQKIEKLIEKRSAAKKLKNWDLADELRAQLSGIGIVLEDKPDGSTNWKKSS